ncbi:MAG TPA: hypothetical protein VF988_15585 [Verrucomicrobiae bacterium]
MPALLIREVPEALDRFLKRSARKNHRSKEKQALFFLEELAATRNVDWTDFLEKPRRKVKDYSDEIRKTSR